MTSGAPQPQADRSAPEPGRSWPYLLVGSVLIFMTFMRYSLPEVAWVAFAPFLVVLHASGSARRHVALLAVLTIAFIVTVSKMATPEIPWAPPVPMFAIPVALAYFVPLAFAGVAHRRLGARWGAYAFAAMAVVVGWIQYTFTPGSSWGVLAHTQLDNLPLVQLSALAGIGGISFLVALGSGLAAAAWSSGVRAVRLDLALFVLVVGAALLYGQLRLGEPAPGASMLIGGVVSPVTHKEFRTAYQDVDNLRPYDDALFARTARAVDRGARIVVWNEMATVVTVEGEQNLVSRAQSLARDRGIMLLIAYGVATSVRPFRDVNKYRLYLPDGTLADEYVKRHPVPGDPDEVGRAHARVVAFEGARVTGAICYDYGFPEIARDNALDGAGVLLLPASDWRGVEPEHARMALMNAVSVGLPMVRPARAATSIVSDPYGRLLASMRADGQDGGVLVAAVPTERVQTLYTRIGEVVPFAALAFCAFVIVRLFGTRRPSAAQSRA
jgi:apolipoprotein N-acyltransferase